MMAQLRQSFFSFRTDWRSARDEYLLQERVHRWGGTTYTGAVLDRVIASPFFDQRFLRMCRSIPPRVKQVNSWAARVLEQLDPALAELPLTSGLRPSQFPRLLAGYTARTVATALTRKVVQTVRPTNRPPVGAAALAGLALRHWRAHPELVADAPSTGLVDEAWLAGLLRGEHGAGPTTVGFLANLQAAAVALRRPPV
jgi:hypothetical protein